MKIDLVEDDRNEFKEEFTNNVIKAVVAFSNTWGGTIYLGIRDNGEIIGVDDQDKVCNSLISSLIDNIRPSIIENFKVTTVKMDGKDIIRVDVLEGSNKPYYWKEKGIREGGVFIRNGPTNIPADGSLILKMVRESPLVPYEKMPSLKQDLTFDETSRIFKDNKVEFGSKQMSSLGIMNEGIYTNLGYMLSDQFSQGIKAAVFGDDYKQSFQDREEISGSVLYQFEKAFEFVDKHNAKRSTIRGAYRDDSRDYPEESVREVIINALVHRDYAINGSILIEMYGDRLTVSSLGGLNKGLGLDDILLGVSSRRNEGLAAIFYRLKLMESYGTGIPRIMGAYQKQPSKPKIELSTNVFHITLPKISTDVLDEDLLRILNELSDGPLGRSDIESRLGMTRMGVLNNIRTLKEGGLIVEEGSGRSTRYKLK